MSLAVTPSRRLLRPRSRIVRQCGGEREGVMATMVEDVGQSLNDREVLDGGLKGERIPEPCIVVIFGASGDLTKRKLLPALFHLQQQHLLPKEFVVVGVA